MMAYQLRESMGKRDVHSMVYPPWTTEDDDHKKYDVTIMRQRSLRRRILQRGSETYSKALKGALPEMRISITGRQRRSEVESESDSAGDDEDSEDDEATDNVQDVTPDLTLEDKVPSLAAPSTDAKIEASGESAMVIGTDGIHSEIHKVLIAVGVVGGVLLLAGIGFLLWRLRRRSRDVKPAPFDDMSFEKPSRFENLVNKVPLFRSRFGHHGWYTIENLTVERFEKQQPPSEFTSRPDSQLPAPSKLMGIYRMASTKSTTTRDVSDAISPMSATFVESTAVQVQVVARHDPREITRPQHKRMPSTTPHVYDIGRRQTGHSTLSSLSSGFGDGDITITPTDHVFPLHPAPVADRHSRRDTASTIATVDPRPRFHTVNSWVGQQKGELRRAQRQAGDGEAPPVPVLEPPPEQELRLMMPDGQTPRQVYA